MEWHLARIIFFAFLLLFALSMDMQSFLSGLRFFKKGAGPNGLRFWPIAFYFAAALTWDGLTFLRLATALAGLAFHLLSTFGVRLAGRALHNRMRHNKDSAR